MDIYGIHVETILLAVGTVLGLWQGRRMSRQIKSQTLELTQKDSEIKEIRQDNWRLISEKNHLVSQVQQQERELEAREQSNVQS